MASFSDDARDGYKSVLDHWRAIFWILDRYEARIRTRWTKLSEKKREEILDKVWPKMCPLHRPDVEANMEIEIMKGDVEPSDYRKSFMWPIINKEDICKGKNFLILLHSRGRYPPEIFAAQDLSATWLGRNIDAIELSGEKEPYGLLKLAWYAEEQRQKGKYSPDKSKEVTLLLEVQEGILKFLYKCCIEILGKQVQSKHAIVQPRESQIISTTVYPNSALKVAEEPYRVPTYPDMKRVGAFIHGRRNQALDHLHALHEDPAYLTAVFEQWRENYLWHMTAARRAIMNPEHSAVRDLVMLQLIRDAYFSVLIWDIAKSDFSKLTKCLQEYNDSKSPKLLVEVLRVTFLLRSTVFINKEHIILRGIWWYKDMSEKVLEIDPNDEEVVAAMREKRTNDYLLKQLSGDSRLEFKHVVDILQRKINGECDSAWRAQRFSDLGLLSLIDHELAKFQPFGLTIEQQYNRSQEALKHRMTSIEPFGSHIMEMENLKFGNKFNPLDGRFDYPSDKQLTKKTSDEMRLAESNLDSFWAGVDKDLRLKVGLSLDEKLNRLLKLAPRQLGRTTKWAEPAAKGSRKSVPASLDSKPVHINVSVKSFKVFRSLFWKYDSSDSPANITWREFVAAMCDAGFAPEELYGSLWQFTPARFAHFSESVQLHAPWPQGLNGKIERKNALRISRILARRFGWELTAFCAERGEDKGDASNAAVDGIRRFAGVLELREKIEKAVVEALEEREC